MRFLRPVLDYPKLTLAAVLVVTVFLAVQMARLRLETDIRNWIPKDNPDIVFDDHVRAVFSKFDQIVIGVECRGPDGVYTPAVLQVIADLSAALEAVDGVLQGEVISIAVTDNITATADGLEVRPFMGTVPETPAELATLRAAIRGNPMYEGRLVSRDEQAAIIAAKVTEEVDRRKIFADVGALLDAQTLPPDTRFVLAGRPVIEGALADLIVDELRVMPLLSNGCMILMLLLVMRSGRGVVLPIAVVVLSIAAAFGLMGLTGVKLYSMSTAIFPLLVAMGVADGIHLLHSYGDHLQADGDADRRTIVARMLDDMTLPVVMTSLTTAGGFLALAFAPILPIKYFGIFTAVGIMAAMVFSLTLIPAGLMLLPLKVPGRRRTSSAGTGPADWILRHISTLVVSRKGLVLVGAAVIIAGGVYQASRLEIDTSLTANLTPGHSVVVAHDYLNEHFEGTGSLDIVFQRPANDALKDPALLQAIDDLQAYAEQLPLVGGSTSVVEYIKRMHQVMNANAPDMYRIPDTRELVAQYLLLYSLSGDPDDFDDVVDYDYRQARVQLHILTDHSSKVAPVIATMRQYVESHFPPEARPRFAGGSHNGFVMQKLVIGGQLVTLVISIVVVYLLTSGMFRSPVGGLVASLPILIATVLNFGIMSQMRIPLGVGNSTLAAIGIGIGIDYAIHYLAKLRRLTAQGMDIDAAALLTTTTTGRAILFNAFVVAAGYLVMLASRFPPSVVLGLLVSFNMLTSFVGAMVVMPVVIALAKPQFILQGAGQGTPARPLGQYGATAAEADGDAG